MVSKEVILSLDRSFYEKLQSKALKSGYRNVQQLAHDLLHHAVSGKKNAGGRPKKASYDDIIMKAISKPTRKSRKLEVWAKRRGIWR